MNYHMTQFEINKRCAELLGLGAVEYSIFPDVVIGTNKGDKDFCNSPADTWPIIEQCWDDLMVVYCGTYDTAWESLMDKYKCTALEAACIYFIERGDCE